MNVEQIEQLLPYYFKSKPKFNAYFKAVCGNYVDIGAGVEQLLDYIDIEKAAGANLDLIGELLGYSRVVSPPIYTAFFSWNIPTLGWGEADWADQTSVPDYSTLNDDMYRAFLKFRAGTVLWDGTIGGLYEVFELAFKDKLSVTIVDNQDMTIELQFKFFETPVALAQAILQGALTFKPMGVAITYSGSI